MVESVPIKAMGRFEHEAAVTDSRTGIVYMTEDCGDPADGFYRYLPDNIHKLHQGGRLQMLAVQGRSRYDTTQGQEVGRRGEVEGRQRLLRRQRRRRRRTRTQPGRYTPNGLNHGVLQLLYESSGETKLEEPDAIAVSPRGGIVVCEDGDGGDPGGDNYIRVLSPAGRLETVARADTPLDLHRWDEGEKGSFGRSEWSGAVYSPDGKWLFVHIRYPGRSFAITGPWERGWL